MQLLTKIDAVLMKNDAGLDFVMNTITKVSDAQTCDKLLSPVNQLKAQYQVRTECVSGPEWDKLLADTFDNKPTSALYISYTDPDGYETRINTKVLTVADASVPSSPAVPPAKETIAWANAMIEALGKGGIKNAKIIYPRKE